MQQETDMKNASNENIQVNKIVDDKNSNEIKNLEKEKEKPEEIHSEEKLEENKETKKKRKNSVEENPLGDRNSLSLPSGQELKWFTIGGNEVCATNEVGSEEREAKYVKMRNDKNEILIKYDIVKFKENGIEQTVLIGEIRRVGEIIDIRWILRQGKKIYTSLLSKIKDSIVFVENSTRKDVTRWLKLIEEEKEEKKVKKVKEGKEEKEYITEKFSKEETKIQRRQSHVATHSTKRMKTESPGNHTAQILSSLEKKN